MSKERPEKQLLELSPLSNIPLFSKAHERKGQYNAELTLSPCLPVKPLITAIRAIGKHFKTLNFGIVGCLTKLYSFLILLRCLPLH